MTCEGVLFTLPVGCGRLLSAVNDLTTTNSKNLVRSSVVSVSVFINQLVGTNNQIVLSQRAHSFLHDKKLYSSHKSETAP